MRGSSALSNDRCRTEEANTLSPVSKEVKDFPHERSVIDMNGPAADPIILVPIRYPLTARSMQTLERAGSIAGEYDAGRVLVLHVNLVQYDRTSTAQDIHRAIAPLVGDLPVTVSVRRGFLVEEVILEEAEQRGADIIVIGRNQTAPWRQYLSRLLGNDPAVASYLQDHTDAEIDVVG